MADSHVPFRIAVVIPVYRAQYLAEALESVFCQSRPPNEVVIVDDGSPDGETLRKAVAPYAGLATVLHQANQGVSAARNRGLRATRSELVAFLDADDRWLPHFLLEQLSQFAAMPRLDLCYTDGLFIGDSPLAGRTFMSVCPSVDEIDLEALLAQRCTVLLSGVVARRSALEQVGGFDESVGRGQDFDLWLRMARAGARMRAHRKVLTLRRIHRDNVTGSAVNAAERPIGVLERALRNMTLSDTERLAASTRLRELRAQLARERGKDLLRRGDVQAARRALVEAGRDLKTWKLQATILAMHVAPKLVRRVYLARALATSAS